MSLSKEQTEYASMDVIWSLTIYEKLLQIQPNFEISTILLTRSEAIVGAHVDAVPARGEVT
jgi:ribonuclease D